MALKIRLRSFRLKGRWVLARVFLELLVPDRVGDVLPHFRHMRTHRLRVYGSQLDYEISHAPQSPFPDFNYNSLHSNYLAQRGRCM